MIPQVDPEVEFMFIPHPKFSQKERQAKKLQSFDQELREYLGIPPNLKWQEAY